MLFHLAKVLLKVFSISFKVHQACSGSTWLLHAAALVWRRLLPKVGVVSKPLVHTPHTTYNNNFQPFLVLYTTKHNIGGGGGQQWLLCRHRPQIWFLFAFRIITCQTGFIKECSQLRHRVEASPETLLQRVPWVPKHPLKLQTLHPGAQIERVPRVPVTRKF